MSTTRLFRRWDTYSRHFGVNVWVRLLGYAFGLALGIPLILSSGCSSPPAEVERLSDPLIAPLPQAPPDESRFGYRTGTQSPVVEFVWRHAMPTAEVPSPHQAERFIICIYERQRGRCESGHRKGVLRPIWFEADADDPMMDRTPIRQERLPFAPAPDIYLGYEFRTRLRMRPEYRGQSLLWQVGACLSGTCRMSDPRSLLMNRRVER
jgi:hypothetical protein